MYVLQTTESGLVGLNHGLSRFFLKKNIGLNGLFRVNWSQQRKKCEINATIFST
jgi:hypothetical protein